MEPFPASPHSSAHSPAPSRVRSCWSGRNRMLMLHCAGHERTRAWAVASALLLSAVGTCAIAAEDLVRGRFERGEVLIPVFAAVCVVIALRVLRSAPRQKLEFRYGVSFESNNRSATF